MGALLCRQCGRGDLEGGNGLRTDSPTAEIETHHLGFRAQKSNASLHGELLDRVLSLQPPKSGLPDPEYEDGRPEILARVPIVLWHKMLVAYSGRICDVPLCEQQETQSQGVLCVVDQVLGLCEKTTSTTCVGQ